jgi:hypothetical protein
LEQNIGLSIQQNVASMGVVRCDIGLLYCVHPKPPTSKQETGNRKQETGKQENRNRKQETGKIRLR